MQLGVKYLPSAQKAVSSVPSTDEERKQAGIILKTKSRLSEGSLGESVM